jgi:hypothetical protein
MPIEGALVAVFAEDEETSDTTDATGYYDVAVPVCAAVVDATMVVTAAGYYDAQVQRELTCSEVNQEDIALEPVATATPTPTPLPTPPELKYWRLR